MYRLSALIAGTAIVLSAASAFSAQTDTFIFSGDQAVSAADQRQFIHAGERLSMQELQRRFPSYSVNQVKSDCGGTCFRLKGRAGDILGIDYGGQGKFSFYRIYSGAPGTRDALGNVIGTPLPKAVGANATRCDDGEGTTCELVQIKGLSYIAGGCDFSGPPIPACATVAGFEILAPQH